MKKTSNTHAYWINRGRVFVEEVKGNVAFVRFDCADGIRGPQREAPVSELDFDREWKFV